MSVRLYAGQRSPSVTDTIKVNGSAFDLTGSTVKFRMRAENASALAIDEAAVVVSEAAGTVRYDPSTTFAALAAGDYVGWWSVTLPSTLVQDTAEFQVELLAHAETATWLCGLTDVREALELPSTDRTRDPLIETYIGVVSDHIQREYQREFTPTTQAARTFEFDPSRVGRRGVLVDLAPYDFRSVGAGWVKLHPESSDPTTLTANTDYRLSPVPSPDSVYTTISLSTGLTYNSALYREFGVCQLEVKADWGYASIPAAVRQAAAETVAANLRRDIPNLGLDLDDPRDLRPLLPSEVTIPGRARRWLQPYKRHSGIY